jgi:hypothetical protein
MRTMPGPPGAPNCIRPPPVPLPPCALPPPPDPAAPETPLPGAPDPFSMPCGRFPAADCAPVASDGPLPAWSESRRVFSWPPSGTTFAACSSS